MNEKVKSLISNLKHSPGVYLMYDTNDEVIYVGKAKDLQKRVSQYFLKPQIGKVSRMVSNVAYFETIITKNEKEAFILEINLIQKYYPRYNILLKDNSHYPYIALKKKDAPTLVLKHNKKDSKFYYFGPFPNSSNARKMVELLNKIFPLQKCKSLGHKECLYYHMHQCLGYCVNKMENEKLDALKDQVKAFLNGENHDIKKEYETKMANASKELNFEEALEYKKIVDAINYLNIEQNVEIFTKKNFDIFAYSTKDNYLALSTLIYRNGTLLDKQKVVVEIFENEIETVISLISQFYNTLEQPQLIIINNQKITDELKTFLDAEVKLASKGKMLELVNTCKENSNNALDEFFLSTQIDTDNQSLLEELSHILNINYPTKIELFDNSHLQGTEPVGAMVCYINGHPNKKLYRIFNIQGENTKDDIASMKQVIKRHYQRLIDDHTSLPNLILIDGGYNQVIAAKSILDELKISIDIFGLYKSDKHQTKGIIDSFGHTYEIENKNLFFLLTRMQDEVHRFAITSHIKKRDKKMTISIFSQIHGLGIKRKERLLRAYPTLELLKHATLEDLSQIIPENVAKELLNELKK